MNQVNQLNRPSILFTELPVGYEKNGFKAVTQEYRAIKTTDLNLGDSDFKLKYYETINTEQLLQIKVFYNNCYPNYDGKVVRIDEPDYWDFYIMMFNPYMKPRIVTAKDDSDKIKGYCRFDVDKDRITVTELCIAEKDDDSCKTLLSFVQKFAKLTGFEILTLTVSKDHFVWDLFKELDIETFAEPDGVRREIFMIRAAKTDKYNDLLWPLADKF